MNIQTARDEYALALRQGQKEYRELINTSRRQRIAKGSGTTVQEVNRLIKQFDQTRKLMKMVTSPGMSKMASMMKRMPGAGMPSK